MFKGDASPRVYRFDRNGIFTEFMIGYADLRLAEWLTSMYDE